MDDGFVLWKVELHIIHELEQFAPEFGMQIVVRLFHNGHSCQVGERLQKYLVGRFWASTVTYGGDEVFFVICHAGDTIGTFGARCETAPGHTRIGRGGIDTAGH